MYPFSFGEMVNHRGLLEEKCLLLQVLAYRVGNLISYHELGQLCRTDSEPVEEYILLLEQCYVIFRLPSFNRNLRNERKQSKKIYFFDNDVRNTLIHDFRQTESRTDTGVLWENFIIAERMKYNEYTYHWNHGWFWRAKEQKNRLPGRKKRSVKCIGIQRKSCCKSPSPLAFAGTYPTAAFKVIHPDNREEFILGLPQ